jgi:uncharacterized cupin superfamily protein
MSKPILNLADAQTRGQSSGDAFEYTASDLARPLGAKAIGANVTRVPPGKAAFPIHHHHANEEHFFILSGTGLLRVGNETYPVRPHDYIVNLPGGPEHAHQLINTGDEDLVYLAISTLNVPEVVGYPDSKKTGVRFAYDDRPDSVFLLEDAARKPRGYENYWKGETGAEVKRLVAESKSK